MRKILLATLLTTALTGAASAADLRRMSPAPAPVMTGYDWTGFYLGGHVGYGFGETDYSVSTSPAAAANPNGAISLDPSGFVGGGQIGFNYQIGMFVVGLEGDISFADLNDDGVASSNVTVNGSVNAPFAYSTDYDWLATITGRVGVAFDRTLVYVKGGVAFGEANYNILVPAGTSTWAADDTRTGWVVGAGVEHAFMQNWTVKLEYNYIDFGDEVYSARFAGGALSATTGNSTIDSNIHVVKLGVNYRF